MYGNMTTKVKLINTTLPTGSGTTELYSTAVACSAKHQLLAGGVKLFLYDIAHDEDGVIRIDKSQDRGISWVICRSIVHAAVANVCSTGAIMVECYDDFRIMWVNDSNDQIVWVVDMSLSNQRAVAP